MGCVGEKPKPQKDMKENPRANQSEIQRNPNGSQAIAQPAQPTQHQSNLEPATKAPESKVQGQPDMVKINDPLKTKEIQGSGIREGNSNPFGSDPRNQENPAVGASGVNASGMANSGQAKGNYQSGIQHSPNQNGNSGIHGSNPQASGGNFESMMNKEEKFGGPNPYMGNSGVQSSNPYVSDSNAGGNPNGQPPKSSIKVSVLPPAEQNNEYKPSSVIKPTESVMVASNNIQNENPPSSGNYSFGKQEEGFKQTESKLQQ